MAENGSSSGADDEVLRQFRLLIGGLNRDDLQDVGQQLMAAAARPLTPVRTPSRRRPRREPETTLRLRVDLQGSKPVIWRRVELGSRLMLDEVHAVLQVLFGWTDSHLYRFALGSSVWDMDAEFFLCPYDVQEGESEGVPAAQVRLDEVLAESGDVLRYVYDYGDDWQLKIKVEAVLVRESGERPARCTGGRRDAPPDDFGGVHASNDDPDEDLTDEFDVADLDEQLAEEFESARSVASLPPVVAGLLARLRGDAGTHAEVLALAERADLQDPATVTSDEAAVTVRRWAWLLDRVGPGGLRLTAAGYLPPVDVEAAMAELGLDAEWIGKGNREDLAWPVLSLRESAQRIGLLRKRKGELLLTAAARAAADDPDALFRHLAGRLLPKDPATFEHSVAVLTLLGLAAGHHPNDSQVQVLTTRALTALGWHAQDSGSITGKEAGRAVHNLEVVLEHSGVQTRDRLARASVAPTAAHRALARMALAE